MPVCNSGFATGAPISREMGLGVLGSRDIIIKRKFRYTFRVEANCGGQILNVPEHFVKSASRPNLSIEETEINFLHGRDWIPGKATWEAITVTYIDVAVPGGNGASTSGASLQNLYTWLASVYDFTDPICLKMGGRRSDYSGNAYIVMYDGCGTGLEQWQLLSCWPQSINFGDLDSAASEEATIELTLRYSGVKYTTLCGVPPAAPCCTGCNGSTVGGGNGIGLL